MKLKYPNIQGLEPKQKAIYRMLQSGSVRKSELMSKFSSLLSKISKTNIKLADYDLQIIYKKPIFKLRRIGKEETYIFPEVPIGKCLIIGNKTFKRIK